MPFWANRIQKRNRQHGRNDDEKKTPVISPLYNTSFGSVGRVGYDHLDSKSMHSHIYIHFYPNRPSNFTTHW